MRFGIVLLVLFGGAVAAADPPDTAVEAPFRQLFTLHRRFVYAATARTVWWDDSSPARKKSRLTKARITCFAKTVTRFKAGTVSEVVCEQDPEVVQRLALAGTFMATRTGLIVLDKRPAGEAEAIRAARGEPVLPWPPAPRVKVEKSGDFQTTYRVRTLKVPRKGTAWCGSRHGGVLSDGAIIDPDTYELCVEDGKVIQAHDVDGSAISKVIDSRLIESQVSP